MTTPLWCLTAVAFFPYVLAGLGGYLRIQQLGTLDNHNPRVQINELTGIGSRVYAAQHNSWEALGLFTAAVLTAHVTGAAVESSATAALLFLACRVLHAACYILDLAVFRSLSAIAGIASCAWLFYLAGSAS